MMNMKKESKKDGGRDGGDERRQSRHGLTAVTVTP